MVTQAASLAAPYAPANNVLHVIEQSRRHATRDPFDHRLLKDMGIPEDNVNRTLAALRFLGLIDGYGNKLQEFTWLTRATPPEYQGVFAEIVRAAYHEVFAIVQPQDGALSDKAVREAFQNYRPAAQQSRMISLFLALARESGIIRPQTNPRVGPIKARKPRARAMDASAESAINVDPTILALLRDLPEVRGPWEKHRKEEWLSLFSAAVNFVYPDAGSDGNGAGR